MTLDEILSDLLLGRCTADEARNLIDWIMFQQSRASAAAEREACAQVCENFNADHQDCNHYDRAMAAAIRARGEK